MNGERTSMADSSQRPDPPRTRYIRYRVSVVDGPYRPSTPGRVHNHARHPVGNQRYMVTEAEWRLFAATVSVGLTVSGIYATFWYGVIR